MSRKCKTKKVFDPKQRWKAFECAVESFLQSLLIRDPNAIISFDPPKNDRDTRQKQQVDVWIEYKIGGHLPIAILVSCKDHGRRLDVGEVRKFLQEIQDSGASTGALYSRSGFTKSAITKAGLRGIGCFELWQDRPADRPIFELYRRYWCWDSIGLPTIQSERDGFRPKTWDELLDHRIGIAGVIRSVSEHLELLLKEGKEMVIADQKTSGLAFPQDFTCALDLQDRPMDSSKIVIECRWQRYQGKLSASLLNGSYCVQTGEFSGTQSAAFPVVYPPPPEDWQLLDENPPKPVGVESILFTKNSAALTNELRRVLSGRPIKYLPDSP